MTRPFQERRSFSRGGLTPLAEVDLGRILPLPLARLMAARSTWKRMVGPAVARRLPVLALEGRTLVIGLPDANWEAFLPRLAKELLPRLRKKRGLEALERILGKTIPAMATGAQEADQMAPAECARRPPAEEGGDLTGELQDPVRRLMEIRDRLLARQGGSRDSRPVNGLHGAASPGAGRRRDQ
ncbi:MAG: DciA family protein [Acidobacteriota bacterium]